MIKIDRPVCPNQEALVTNYKNPRNKEALAGASFGKCMYCEEKILSSQFGDVEHIKPKSKFKELEFDWDNLGIVCSKCNNAKSNKYNEETPFINPYDEDPTEHLIAFGPFLKQKKGSERGELTINEIALNRSGLIEKRSEKIKSIEKAIEACFRTKTESLKSGALEQLKEQASKDKEYSLFVQSFLQAHNII